MLINIIKSSIFSVLTMSVVFIGGCSSVMKPSKVMNIDNIAIGGYDAVAYFNTAKAIKPEGSLTYEYEGLIWLFDNEQNLNTFKNDPEWYMPKYKGYCAYELAQGDIVESDGAYWHIHNKELYLFNDEEAKEDWYTDITMTLQASEKVWDSLAIQARQE